MKKISIIIASVVLACACAASALAADNLMLFCGAGFKKPVEEIVDVFQKRTNTRVDAAYAAIGTLFSQMLLTKQGDVFIAPSPDVMDKATEKKVIVPGSVRTMAYTVPSINVQKGNPKNIRGLRDLLKPGVKVAIANPEIVYVGLLAVEIVQKALTDSEIRLFRANVVTYAEDINKLATFLVLKQVDAVIGFHFLEGWYPDKIETIKLKADEVQRIGASEAGIISFSKNKEGAQRFVDFLLSGESERAFQKYHYFNSPDAAFAWLGGKKPIGGDYTVPAAWVTK